MLGAGFKSSPPGDWVKPLCWKPPNHNEAPKKLKIKLPATGLSRFVGNLDGADAHLRLRDLPATGLSRFVGNW